MIMPKSLPNLIFFLFMFLALSLSSSQPNSPQNIETYYNSVSSHTSPVPRSPTDHPVPPAPYTAIPPSSPPPTNRTVAKAVVATAASTLFVAGIMFLFFRRFAIARRRRRKETGSGFHGEETMARKEFKGVGGTFKGSIADENGLDVLYLRRLEGGQLGTSFSKVVLHKKDAKEEQNKPRKSRPIQEVPLLHMPPSDRISNKKVSKPDLQSPTRSPAVPAAPTHPSQPTRPPIPPVMISVKQTLAAPPPPESIPSKQIPAHPSPPPVPTKRSPAPPPPPPPIPPKRSPAPAPPPPLVPATRSTALTPPPPPVPEKRNTAPPPPPPPVPAKRNPAPAPPPPKSGSLVSSLKPPPAPRGKESSNRRENNSTEESSEGTSAGQMKLKPLHWDKVIANADHSMVWDKINDGSFRFDDELMEALFGYTSNRKSPERNSIPSNSSTSNSSQPTQIFILEPRKSQNIAIVLKSLATSRREILDAVIEGQGLNADTLEKLTKISPTQEEVAEILKFNGDPNKLADAESFLYHILKAVPSAFTRFSAMLFRSNYDPEILELKKSLQVLEMGCKELRTPGIFLKLLEAILKAGNRMNNGTARGNAQGFNLTALRKLSDVKSTDGKTTLLHFVVEQVVQMEGRRCVVNRNHSIGRTNSPKGKNRDPISENPSVREEREREYLMLGLPVLGGLSDEFSNVKKAASIDNDSFINMCSTLSTKVAEIQQLVTRCGDGEGGGFSREMKGFLEGCEEELKVVREEQARVMELVKRTTEYYQAGVSKEKGAQQLQLFLLVKDFLDMVDQACIDIARKIQKKNVKNVGSSSSPSPTKRTALRIPNWQSHFLLNHSRTTYSSESDDDF